MVVLALVAALIGIAFPTFVRLYARARVSFERKDLEHQLASLPERVRASGEAGVLADPKDDLDGKPAYAEARRLKLDLPQDWSMRVPSPIFYHFTGACDGGEVTFALPPVSLHYVLTPPLCRPRLADAR
jgi:type II secretory pathway pseudopilin PulG